MYRRIQYSWLQILNMAKILLLSAHESLEAQLLTIYNKLGHSVFSVGHYTDLKNPIHPTHDVSHLPFDQEAFDIFCKYHDYQRWSDKIGSLKPGDLPPYTIRLKKPFVDLYDLIVLCYYEENLTLNWDLFKNKPVIVYQISQKNYHRSDKIRKPNVFTAHMSPKEHVLHGYKPHAVIHHAVDCEYYKGYQGGTDEVLTITKWMKRRGKVSAYPFYDKVTEPFNRVLAGFGNDDLDYAKSDVSETELLDLRRRCGLYFSTCSWHGNVSYSFVESLAMGCPMLTSGPRWGNEPGLDTFSAHEYIKQGINGFTSDNLDECQEYIRFLLQNPTEARIIGQNGRKTALKEFSIERATKDWDELLRKVV